MFYVALLGGNPIQRLILVDVLARGPDESIPQIFLQVITSTGTFFTYQFCLLAPIILIVLAFLRGRRLGMPYMVVFPFIGLVFTLLGPLPFVSLGEETAIGAPSAFTWLFDGWCLYLGLQPDPVDIEA